MPKSTTVADRRIKFLSRDLPFPVDPTFREYRKIEELTDVTAQEIMTGEAGVWMLPILAIVAMMRDNKNVTHDQLDRILDLNPNEIDITGFNDGDDDEEDPPVEEDVEASIEKQTGTKSTDETPEPNGTQDSPTTSPEQPENQTT